MGSLGLPEILVIALVFLVLFGAGKFADIGKGLGQGIKNFKQGVREADEIGKKEDAAAAKATDAKSEPTAKGA